jgi:hypothetical protein
VRPDLRGSDRQGNQGCIVSAITRRKLLCHGHIRWIGEIPVLADARASHHSAHGSAVSLPAAMQSERFEVAAFVLCFFGAFHPPSRAVTTAGATPVPTQKQPIAEAGKESKRPCRISNSPKRAPATRDSRNALPMRVPIRCTEDAISCPFDLSNVGIHFGRHRLQAI